YSVAFSPDTRTLASGSYDGTVKLWEVATGRERGTLKGHEGAVYSVAFAPDGHTIASGSFDATVRLWNLKTSTLSATLRGHTGFVWSVAFAPNGKRLASGSGIWREKPGGKSGSEDGYGEGDVKVWDLSTRKHTFSQTFSTGRVLSVALAADGRTLAVCGPDATVRLWDSATGKPHATLKGHTAKVCGVAFAASGKMLASGSKDTTIRLWEVPPLEKAGQ